MKESCGVSEEIVKKDSCHSLKWNEKKKNLTVGCRRYFVIGWWLTSDSPFFIGEKNATLAYGAQIAHCRVDNWSVHFHTGFTWKQWSYNMIAEKNAYTNMKHLLSRDKNRKLLCEHIGQGRRWPAHLSHHLVPGESVKGREDNMHLFAVKASNKGHAFLKTLKIILVNWVKI